MLGQIELDSLEWIIRNKKKEKETKQWLNVSTVKGIFTIKKRIKT